MNLRAVLTQPDGSARGVSGRSRTRVGVLPRRYHFIGWHQAPPLFFSPDRRRDGLATGPPVWRSWLLVRLSTAQWRYNVVAEVERGTSRSQQPRIPMTQALFGRGLQVDDASVYCVSATPRLSPTSQNMRSSMTSMATVKVLWNVRTGRLIRVGTGPVDRHSAARAGQSGQGPRYYVNQVRAVHVV